MNQFFADEILRKSIGLYSFGGGDIGLHPSAALVQDSDGNLYDTTPFGGMFNLGSVFEISTNGVPTSLYSFVDGYFGVQEVGAGPNQLVQTSGGTLYGTTTSGGGAFTNLSANHGILFSIVPYGNSQTVMSSFRVLHIFAGTNDGISPEAGLMVGSDGNFYGTTSQGGMNNAGTIFQYSYQSGFTTLYSFTGENDGGNPGTGLVQGKDGSFYGAITYGGRYGKGTIFKVSRTGALKTLYSFTGGADGANPQAALVQGNDGSFYGTTFDGGLGGAGTVFRLTIVPPPLTITLSGANVILSWPTNTELFTLEFATNLVPATIWQTNLQDPVIISGQYVETSPLTGNQMFFRLSQ